MVSNSVCDGLRTRVIIPYINGYMYARTCATCYVCTHVRYVLCMHAHALRLMYARTCATCYVQMRYVYAHTCVMYKRIIFTHTYALCIRTNALCIRTHALCIRTHMRYALCTHTCLTRYVRTHALGIYDLDSLHANLRLPASPQPKTLSLPRS